MSTRIKAGRKKNDRGLSQCLHHKKPVSFQPEVLARRKEDIPVRWRSCQPHRSAYNGYSRDAGFGF